MSQYASGDIVKLGDRVRLGEDSHGVVVAVLDSDGFGADHPKSTWGSLEAGVLVNFPKFGLIHYLEPEPEIELVQLRVDDCC